MKAYSTTAWSYPVRRSPRNTLLIITNPPPLQSTPFAYFRPSKMTQSKPVGNEHASGDDMAGEY